MSVVLFVSPGTRSVASDVKATQRPSAEIASPPCDSTGPPAGAIGGGPPLWALPWVPSVATETMLVTPGASGMAWAVRGRVVRAPVLGATPSAATPQPGL